MENSRFGKKFSLWTSWISIIKRGILLLGYDSNDFEVGFGDLSFPEFQVAEPWKGSGFDISIKKMYEIWKSAVGFGWNWSAWKPEIHSWATIVSIFHPLQNWIDQRNCSTLGKWNILTLKRKLIFVSHFTAFDQVAAFWFCWRGRVKFGLDLSSFSDENVTPVLVDMLQLTMSIMIRST